jgi:hypothetical protein
MLASLRMQMPFLGAGSTEATRLEELEMLSLGVEGKRLLWKTLEELKTTDMRLEGFDFTELEQRANGQRERLERFRLRYAAEALRVRAA